MLHYLGLLLQSWAWGTGVSTEITANSSPVVIVTPDKRREASHHPDRPSAGIAVLLGPFNA